MYSTWQLAIKYLKYYFTASNGKGHGTHSPFIFHFITHVLNDKEHYHEYERAEGLRKKMLDDNSVITVEDLGAGSSISRTSSRTISSIAKAAAKSKKMGQLLFRIVKEYQPETIVELGTSLGITTSYLSLANKDAEIITMEGAKEVAAIAAKNFELFGSKNTRLVEGNFDYTLLPVISGLTKIDLAFIDGNHRQEPTERYFSQLLSKTHNDSILIFDDIHWSREMEQAWKTIQDHPSVRCSIDLFFIGIVFFRQEFREKQHFTVRF
ncbi:MAG: SAM-dependent methyltransferase [Chitinophagaceae bacterium]|nr:SAM-dependent methyltransferase [Chitinophagaceae bacterium]